MARWKELLKPAAVAVLFVGSGFFMLRGGSTIETIVGAVIFFVTLPLVAAWLSQSSNA